MIKFDNVLEVGYYWKWTLCRSWYYKRLALKLSFSKLDQSPLYRILLFWKQVKVRIEFVVPSHMWQAQLFSPHLLSNCCHVFLKLHSHFHIKFPRLYNVPLQVLKEVYTANKWNHISPKYCGVPKRLFGGLILLEPW